MNFGYLSNYFQGVAAKRLRPVEIRPDTSNQHELNGSGPLRTLLGEEEFTRRPAAFIWLGDENAGLSETGWLSWYDARKNQPHRSAEWRLYYPHSAVLEMAEPGDLLIVARQRSGELLIVVVPQQTTLENQLIWLFALDASLGEMFELERFGDDNDRELDFAARYILDELGIEIEEPDADRLDGLLEQFGDAFPTTREFSSFARDTLEGCNPIEDPDETLLSWMSHEEALFRRLERKIVSDRLTTGFSGEGSVDVDGFLKFSLSVQNRRKSRVGYALENHLEAILIAHGIRYQRGAETEHRAKPDFLFPGAAEYHDASFPVESLAMLGAKSTCKDRWRQVLSEAARIPTKHLLTLEPGISGNQTEEMIANSVQLVLPKRIHESYTESQKSWLMNLSDFVDFIAASQN